MKYYVVTLNSAGVTIYGPYDDQTSAAVRGRAWQLSNEDDPRWQVLAYEGELPVARVSSSAS